MTISDDPLKILGGATEAFGRTLSGRVAGKAADKVLGDEPDDKKRRRRERRRNASILTRGGPAAGDPLGINQGL